MSGRGNDRVVGTPGNDLLGGGAGFDTILSRAGDDRVSTVDRQRDIVNCGSGNDEAKVDAIDAVTGCERIVRR